MSEAKQKIVTNGNLALVVNEKGRVVVSVTRSFDKYFKGDVCGLEPDFAAKAILKGYATPADLPQDTKNVVSSAKKKAKSKISELDEEGEATPKKKNGRRRVFRRPDPTASDD